jgi:hypothetical protein
MRQEPIDYDSLLRFAKTLEGQTLRTNAGRAKFTVRVEGQTLYYTPTSTGEERRGSRKSVEKVLRYYNNTGSMRLQDYNSMTVNSVCLLRLITMMTAGETK